MALKIGPVPYLNVLPLLEGLAESLPGSEFVRATPRDLAGMLARAEVDIACVSTFEGLRCGYSLIDGCAIACDGPVESVVLFSRVPLREIDAIHLDPASLSSSALLRIVAKELLEIEPEWIEGTVGGSNDQRPTTNNCCSAFLAIGDRALALNRTWDGPKLDLGEAWKRLTGLPFVFAGWWVRHGVAVPEEVREAFVSARQRGEHSVGAIVGRFSPEYLAPFGGAEGVTRYLTQCVRHRLGPREVESIERYRNKLLRHGLLPLDAPIWGLLKSTALAGTAE